MSANEQSVTPENQESETTGMKALAELLAADADQDNDEDSPGGDEGKPSGSEKKAEPVKRFNDLAGATGLDLDALYKLEVSLSEGGDPVTIEQLKDTYAQREDLSLRELEFEERKTQQESELLRASAELQEILQALPANAVKKEVLDKIRAKSEQTAARERQRTLDAIPEWKDETKRADELTAMTEHLGQYGIPPNYLQQVMDHRHFKYIRDNMLRERRVREAIAKVRSGKPEGGKPSKPQGKAPSKRTAVKTSKGVSKLESIFSSLE
jgi:hypothetical protein